MLTASRASSKSLNSMTSGSPTVIVSVTSQSLPRTSTVPTSETRSPLMKVTCRPVAVTTGDDPVLNVSVETVPFGTPSVTSWSNDQLPVMVVSLTRSPSRSRLSVNEYAFSPVSVMLTLDWSSPWISSRTSPR